MADYKRIVKSIRLYYFMISLVYSALCAIVMFGVMILSNCQDQWLIGLAVLAGMIIVFGLVSLIIASGKCRFIKKRIHACNGRTSLESEAFTPCAKELSYGNEWLVYHRNNTYLFWTKENIHEIKVLSNKKNHYNIAIFSEMHPEGEAIHCTATQESIDNLCHWQSVNNK